MVLESTVICVDGSDFMRNGDFVPTRLQAQQDAVSLVCHAKLRANPENNCALVVCRDRVEVLCTLTGDVGKILSKAHQIQPSGSFNFTTGLCVAHLALKHRIGKNHRMRVVMFVGSPMGEEEKDLVKLAKRLKKEKVNVSVINFGNEADNEQKLTAFVDVLNGKEGQQSHIVNIPTGPMLTEPLMQSAIILGEDGAAPPGFSAGGGFEFGLDPNEDPELVMALRISLEEQRQRQQATGSQPEGAATEGSAAPAAAPVSDEDAMLQQALAMSVEGNEGSSSATAAAAQSGGRDLDAMTEEEQMALAMQMSMEVDAPAQSGGDEAVLSDPAQLQEILRGLPGVNPDSEEVRNAVKELQKGNKKQEESDDPEAKKKRK